MTYLGDPISYKRIMALDVGDARVGIALSDRLGISAQPYQSVVGTGQKALREIADLVQREDVSEIVIGLPLELSGECGPQAIKVKTFAQKLVSILQRRSELTKVKTRFWDERFTTAEASRIVRDRKLRNREKRAALDRVSASLILQGYLDSRKLGIGLPEPDDDKLSS